MSRRGQDLLLVLGGVAGVGALLYLLLPSGNPLSAAIDDAENYLLTGNSVADLTTYLAARLPAQGTRWAPNIAQGIAGTMPLDFVDPNGGDAGLRWAIDVGAVGQYESAYGYAAGYSPIGDPTGWGDGGNAFGFWQLDKHYNSDFINSDAAQDPGMTVTAQAQRAAQVLAGNWRSFKGVVDPAQREQLMFITYNASLSRIRGLIASGASIAAADATTTQRSGQGYGQNVVNLVESLA